MGLEIEAKFKVDSHEQVRERLRTVGARSLGRVLETNVLFDSVDGTLRAAGHGLRVRFAAGLDGQADKTTVTFKGPRLKTELKTRQEIEITADDAAKAKEILAALGFVEFFVFQKRRETWRLDPCNVELDELPDLGRFVEIEGPDKAAILGAQKKIGLVEIPPNSDTYIAMLIKHRRKQNRPFDRVMFED